MKRIQGIAKNGWRTLLHGVTVLAWSVFAAVSVNSQTAQQAESMQKIAFHYNDGTTSQVYIMNADGTEQTQLTNNSASNVAPEISPDGSQIAFVSDRDGTDHVYLMDLDGGNQHRLTEGREAEGEPTWSPDGSRIYFRRELNDGRVVICVVERDGGNPLQLTDGSIRYLRSTISPDGSQILAVSVSRGFELYVMDADGSGQRRFPNVPSGISFASWSPDGGRIAYATATPPPNPSADIFVVNADGTGERQLTRAEGVSEYPCWSPDGREIAFQSSRDGDFDIYIMNADGSNPRRITDHPGFDGRPSWRVVER